MDRGALEVEEWRAVDGWPGYEISSYGRIRSWKARNGRGMAKQPRLLTSFPDKDGYLRINLMDQPNGYRQTSIHRLVLEAFVGACPDGMVSAHSDGDRINNMLDNLRWKTQQQNIDDRERHGNTVRGEDVKTGKLTPDDVHAIRASDETCAILADRHGVNTSTISAVRTRRTWRHI